MDDSILNSIKKLLGISEDDKSFDSDILMHINTTFMYVTKLGVGPSIGFHIEDETDEWTKLLQTNKLLDSVKTYIYLKVKLVFDPPASSTIVDVINKTIQELEWRILDVTEHPETTNQE